MCLVAIAHRVFPEKPFLLAANRDERFARPAAPASWWSYDGVDIFGGRDLEKGGTWLGVTRRGRLALVTNVRDPAARRAGASRGFLVRDALVARDVPPAIDRPRFPAFNLLVADAGDLFSLRDDETDASLVSPGVHGLSNLRLDVSWPKVARARSIFLGPQPPDVEAMFRMLRDDAVAPDPRLPRTGIPLEIERALSPPFVRIPAAAYGTRCSTVVTRDARGTITFEERTWDERGELAGVVRETWSA